MDFGDLQRGGTAPTSSKPIKLAAAAPTSRPKTRAVDSDIHDTNIDLKINRQKPATNPLRPYSGRWDDHEALVSPRLDDGEIDFLIAQHRPTGLPDHNGIPSTQPRAPSRNRNSKDPKRQQPNALLSAYSQNIPSMILHPSKKPVRTSAQATASPRPNKESRNLTQLNDIRNAYGADLPSARPQNSSPIRPKAPGSANSVQSSNTSGSNSNPSRLNGGQTLGLTAPGHITPIHIQYEDAVAAVASDGGSFTGSHDSNDDVQSHSSAAVPLAGLRSPTETTTSVGSLTSATGGSRPAALLRNSSLSKNLKESGGNSPGVRLSNSGASAEVPSKSARPNSNSKLASMKKTTGLTGLLKSNLVASATAQLDTSTTTTDPTANLVTHYTEESMFKQVAGLDWNTNSAVETYNDIGVASDMDAVSVDSAQFRSVEGDQQSAAGNNDVDVGITSPDQRASFLDIESPQRSESRSSLPLEQSSSKTSIAAAKELAPTESLTPVRKSPPNVLQGSPSQRSDRYLDSSKQSIGLIESENAKLSISTSTATIETNEDSPSSSRPQSRKLYLGSEHSQRRMNDHANATNALKAPRSAGARFGTNGSPKYVDSAAPSSGPQTDSRPNLRRLASHNDITHRPAANGNGNTTVAAAERPPSRQSSAFPTHLAGEKDSENDPAVGHLSSAIIGLSSNTHSHSSVVNTRSRRSQSHPEEVLPVSLIGSSSGTESLTMNPSPLKQQLAAALPNTEPKLIKKAKPMSGSAVTIGSYPSPASASVAKDLQNDHILDARPPSRQKIVPQHLFDDGTSAVDSSRPVSSRRTTFAADARSPFEEFSSVGAFSSSTPSNSILGTSLSGQGSKLQNASSSSSSSAMNPPMTSTAVGSSRVSTTRGNNTHSRSGLNYDPREDGFFDMDPDEQMPFIISINYGHETVSSNSIGPLSSSRRPSRNALAVNDDSMMCEQLSEISLLSNGNNTSSGHGTGAKAVRKSAGHNRNDDVTDQYIQRNMRPKTVHPHMPPATVSRPIVGGRLSPNYMDAQINGNQETLRSKSANNYAPSSHARDAARSSRGESTFDKAYMAAPPANHKPANRSMIRQHHASSAWDDQDPRNIPRAQNTFGLEADCGWTSPSMLAGGLSDSASPNLLENYVLDDEDDLTILTEDSGHQMDHSVSIPGFPIESSLGEDFLNLFGR